jgi:hypothetical protein
MDNKMVVKPIIKEEWKTAVEIIGLKFHINKILKMIKSDDKGNSYLDRDSVVDPSQLDESKESFWGCANNPYYVSLYDGDKEDTVTAGKKQKIEMHFTSDTFPAKLLCILSYKYNLIMEMVTKPNVAVTPVVVQISPIGVRQLEAEEVIANQAYWLDKLKG